MKLSGEDLRKALIVLSFGLEPIIFAIVGWYAGPYLNLTRVAGALLGVAAGFGIMIWRIWKFWRITSLEISRAMYDLEKDDLRSLTSLIENERYIIIGKDKLIKIMGAQAPLQLLTVLKGLSLVSRDFYDLSRLDQVLDEMTDFSKTFSEVRARSSINFLKVLDYFNDFLTLLCVNFAFRCEVANDEVAKGYVVTPFKCGGGPKGLLREDVKYYLADEEVRGLYSNALNEALTINSRAPILALASYSLIKMGRELEISGYAHAYSRAIGKLALELLSIADDDLVAEGKNSEVVKAIRQKNGFLKALTKEAKFDKSKEKRDFKEEDLIRSFIDDAYRTLTGSFRLPSTARTVLSYLFVKWGEKVSLKLAFMAANNEVAPHRAFASLMVPC